MGPLTKEQPESANTTRDSVAHVDLSASQGARTATIDAFGIEIPVRLQAGQTGAGAHGAANPYQEDTCTLIVFPQGAVLRSSTSLAAGQHLLLKNQRTNQEIPCRVVNLRSYSTGYVEIEFDRPAPGFWGVIFPSETSKPPKQAAIAPPAPAVSPGSKPHTQPGTFAPSKDIAARSLPAKASKPLSLPAAPATPAAIPQKADEYGLALPRREQEALPVADSVAKRPVEKNILRSNHATRAEALPSSQGSLEEKEHWATLSYGRFSSFQVIGVEEQTRDDFSLDVPPPVRERHSRPKLFFTGISAAALILALGTGAFFMRRHSRKAAFMAASQSPTTTPAPERPNPVLQPLPTANSPAESVQIPPQPSLSTGVNSNSQSSQPSKQTSPETAEIVASQPRSKAPPASKPAPKPSFKLAPNAAAPERASVSRETTPPATGDEVVASPGGIPGPSSIVPDALRSDAEVPPPPPAETQEKAPERVGGDVRLPQLLHMVPPSYPLAAKQINLQGEVTVQARVDITGKVIDAKVVSGPVLLQQAAVDAVRHWKYAAATLDGKPVSMQVVVKVKFGLH